MYRSLQLLLLALGIASAGCQVLADIESHPVDELSKGCTLPAPAVTDGKVRLTNVLASPDFVDVCMRPSGSASYGRPVLRSSGTNDKLICRKGLGYGESTQPFKAPTGKIDVKVIKSGLTCAAQALAETKNIDVGTDYSTSLVYLSDGGAGARVLSMIDALASVGGGNRNLRFFNAVPGGYAFEWGIAASGQDKLPTTIETRFNTKPLELGQVCAPTEKGSLGNFVYDENGYTVYGTSKNPVGAALAKTSKALMVSNFNGAGNYTYFAVGDPSKGYPIRGLVCTELDTTDPAKEKCVFTELESFSIDVFNAGLYGAFAKVESLRAGPVLQALADRSAVSDVLCVSEIARRNGPADTDPHMDWLPDPQKEWTQDKLVSLATGYPYHILANTNLDTPITDPANQNGEIPPPQGRGACDSAVNPATVNAAYNCLIKNCSTGGEGGYVQGGTDCFSQFCSNELAPLLFGDQNAQQCYVCLLTKGLSYQKWVDNRTQCATETRSSYAFEGAAPSLLLSKFPFTETETYVLPSNAFRRVALFGRMKYDGEKTIDVYCVHAPAQLGANVAYAGGYNNGVANVMGNAWKEEQIWATKVFIDYVKRKSEGRAAIIVGDWSSSKKALKKDGTPFIGADTLPAVGDSNPGTMEALQGAFLEALPDDPYAPECTRCPATRPMERSNKYNLNVTEVQWNLRAYIKDPWVTQPATGAGLFYTDTEVVEIDDPTFGMYGPYSDTFGYNVRISRP